MIRTKGTRRPDAILTSDWHIREDQPTCRTDDFELAQWKKIDIIKHLQQQYDCPVLHAGDLFHHWKPSPYLLSKTMEHLPDKFFTVYGQHDLPQHNLDLAHKCGINTLATAELLRVLDECHWGQKPEVISWIDPLYKQTVLVWHRMTYIGKPPYPGCTDPVAGALLRKYPQFSLILTGDNHIPFTTEHEGRLLVNPGSLTRQTASQADHRPRVYLWYADTNTVEPYYLTIDPEVVSREHIERKEQRDDRIDAFVSQLDGQWDIGLSFEENLQQFIQANQIKSSVVEIINKAISHENRN